VTLTNNLTVSGSGNLTLNGAVGGAGGLTMSGLGTLILGNAKYLRRRHQYPERDRARWPPTPRSEPAT